MTTNFANTNERIDVEGVDIQVDVDRPTVEPMTTDLNTPLLEAAEPDVGEQISSTASSASAAADRANAAASRVGQQATQILQNLPTYANRFYHQYRSLLWAIGFLFLALLSLRLLSALIGTINSIPLMELLLELVGLGYVIWFSYRYLLTVENRRELSQKLNRLKGRVLGGTEELS
jgi:hypothetical protein